TGAFVRRGIDATLAGTLAAALASGCNTSGAIELYTSGDQSAIRERSIFYQGQEVYCVFRYTSGREDASVRMYWQTLEFFNNPVNHPPQLAVDAPSTTGSELSFVTVLPPPAEIYELDTSVNPPAYVLQKAVQAPGKYRCIGEIEDQRLEATFVILPSPIRFDPPAPPAGFCTSESVSNCPAPAAGYVPCCDPTGTCGQVRAEENPDGTWSTEPFCIVPGRR
ncbi:MAG: hypothetical protein KDI32_14850, partial [Pseudomonadales bacterium]|nr:hypothetical protein [Pseudomonadales bacterium]